MGNGLGVASGQQGGRSREQEEEEEWERGRRAHEEFKRSSTREGGGERAEKIAPARKSVARRMCVRERASERTNEIFIRVQSRQ